MAGDASHALSGWPPEQPEHYARMLRRAGLVAVLVGHGGEQTFISMPWQGRYITLDVEDVKQHLGEGDPAPPMFIFTCDSGQFDWREESLAEALLAAPAGPAAVIGATTESHPLTNYFTGLAGIRHVAPGHGIESRLGLLWLSVQREALKVQDPIMERILKDIEGKLEDEIDVAKLRRDQTLMYALLGDPATRLRFPDALYAECEPEADALRWTAYKPAEATKLIVGVRRPFQVMGDYPAATEADGAWEALEAFNEGLGFKTLTELDADAEWTGRITGKGQLRLIAVAPDRIFVKVLDLPVLTGKAGPPQAGDER
jgi:hypothetical protein